jgi:hypothetical protein
MVKFQTQVTKNHLKYITETFPARPFNFEAVLQNNSNLELFCEINQLSSPLL